MFKRSISFSANDFPPKLKEKGETLWLLDPRMKRWCLVGRFLSRREMRWAKVMVKKDLYNRGLTKVYKG